MPRVILFVACSLALIAFSRAPAVAEQELRIGSPAPELDIEHWLQDGNGFFKPVKKFKKGKVYVVEFWATWCGPCIQSMPHLADLQNKYRGEGLQVISISDETVDEINDLMQREHPQAGKPFSEVTSAYSLTTDPDRSVHKDYMDASNQQGIPTSFIVGKTGQIEWIGHPMEMDQPLDDVINDKWDREKFAKAHRAKAEFESSMERLGMLAGAGKFDDAIKFIEKQIAQAKKDDIEDLVIQYTDVRFSLKISSGKIDEETIAYYREHIETIKDDPIALARFGYALYGAFQQGGDLGPLASDLISAIDKTMDKAPKEATPFLQNTIAQLHVTNKDFTKALAAQQKAYDAADERQKRRLKPFLDELKSKLDESKESSDK